MKQLWEKISKNRYYQMVFKNPFTYITEALKINKAISSHEADILLKDLYETHYGIYDHISSNRPLGSVAIHPNEDNGEGSLLYESIENFSNTRIYEKFGLNLLEFLSLPNDICLKILKVSSSSVNSESNELNQIAKDLKKLEK